MADAALKPPERAVVRRHGLVVRVTHWVDALAILVLLMSGLQIFNAHPALYWGHDSTFAEPWVAVTAAERAGEPIGLTKIGPAVFETTGVLGWSGAPRAFPGWATLPSYRSLADGRRWHFFFAWIFVLNGLIYLAAGVVSGHFRRDLWPDKDQRKPRHIWRDTLDHLRLRFPKGRDALRYNVLQKAAYLAVVFILLPLMVLSGLGMAPAIDAAYPWIVDLFGGRQSARTAHFLSAALITIFVLVHVTMVLLSGAWNNLRAMVTGRFVVEETQR